MAASPGAAHLQLVFTRLRLVSIPARRRHPVAPPPPDQDDRHPPTQPRPAPFRAGCSRAQARQRRARPLRSGWPSPNQPSTSSHMPTLRTHREYCTACSYQPSMLQHHSVSNWCAARRASTWRLHYARAIARSTVYPGSGCHRPFRFVLQRSVPVGAVRTVPTSRARPHSVKCLSSHAAAVSCRFFCCEGGSPKLRLQAAVPGVVKLLQLHFGQSLLPSPAPFQRAFRRPNRWPAPDRVESIGRFSISGAGRGSIR